MAEPDRQAGDAACDLGLDRGLEFWLHRANDFLDG